MSESPIRKKTLFEREFIILRDSKNFLKREDITLDECKTHIQELNHDFEDLLDQSKLITKVSDRLQKKINKANEALEEKNVQLQESLDALVKAKVGRKATTIVLIIFITLFLVVEGVAEPYIEAKLQEWFHDALYETVGGLLLKGLLALLLRPVEKLVEKILMKKALAEKEKRLALENITAETKKADV